MSPNQAWNIPEDPNLIKINGSQSQYLKEFKKLYRTKFNLKDKVLIEENVINRQNKIEDRFKTKGTIKEILENDTYLVITEDDKLVKKSQSQLVKIY